MNQALTLALAALLFASGCEDSAPAPAPAAPCTLTDGGDGTYLLTCGDSSVRVRDGADGRDAAPCLVTDNADGTYTLTCGDGSVVVSRGTDGRDAEPCLVTDNGDGTHTLTCGDDAVVIRDGAAGGDGEPCQLTDHGDGTFTVTCGEASVHFAEPPRIRFLAPAEGDTVAGRIRVELEVVARAGVDRVELTLDAQPEAVLVQAPFAWDADLSALAPGVHRFAATVVDLAARRSDAAVSVTVLPPVAISSPYADVDWSLFARHKANFHTHTTMSDGALPPASVIDEYAAMGYSVLALTDHNTTTWTWQDHGRDPAALGMVAVQGSEPSLHHHLGSLFNDFAGDPSDVDVTLQTIGARNGLAILFHPGRYGFPASWYVDRLRSYDHLLGFEVHNQGDRYPGDRALWDEVLTELLPGRQVWGFSDDDAHLLEQMGRNWQTLLLPELTEAAVRDALTRGHFYFSYAPVAGNPAPVIHAITVDEGAGTIALEAEGWDDVYWISGGVVVQSGSPVIAVRSLDGYLRAELEGPAGITYTQPFFVGDPAVSTVVHLPNLRVGLDGLPAQRFGRRPGAESGWTTRALPGEGHLYRTPAHLDTVAQTLDATAAGWEPVGEAASWPPTANALARWNGDAARGRKLQTRPTLVAGTALLATLENHTGHPVSSLEVFYDLGSWLPWEAEGVFGHRVYFSLTGAPDSWQPVPELSSRFSPTETEGETGLAALLDLGAWAPGAPLYLLWADPNGPGDSVNSGTGREGAYTIDGFGVRAVRAAAGP